MKSFKPALVVVGNDPKSLGFALSAKRELKIGLVDLVFSMSSVRMGDIERQILRPFVMRQKKPLIIWAPPLKPLLAEMANVLPRSVFVLFENAECAHIGATTIIIPRDYLGGELSRVLECFKSFGI